MRRPLLKWALILSLSAIAALAVWTMPAPEGGITVPKVDALAGYVHGGDGSINWNRAEFNTLYRDVNPGAGLRRQIDRELVDKGFKLKTGPRGPVYWKSTGGLFPIRQSVAFFDEGPLAGSIYCYASRSKWPQL